MKDVITFKEFMISKGIVNLARLHPRELANWREAYRTEVAADQQEARHAPDEIQLHAGDDVTLEAACEISGHPAGLVIEAAEGEKKLPTFTMTAYNGGPMFPGGWYEQDPIIIDLAGMETAQSVPIDYGHGTDIGHTTAVDKAVKSLKTTGVLSAFTADAGQQDASAIAARKVVRMGGNGFPFQASIAPSVLRSKIEFVKAGETAKVNGRTFPGPVHVARQSILKKIAILPLGADSTTSTTVAASPKKETAMNPFDTWLVANDFDPAIVNANPKMKAKLEAQHRAEINPPVVQTVQVAAAKTTSFDEKMLAIEAENTRIRYIEDRTAQVAEAHAGNPEMTKTLRELCATAIGDKGTDQRAYDLALMRLDRGHVPNMIIAHQPQLNSDVVEAALTKHMKTPGREDMFDEKTLTASDKIYKHGLSLLEAIGVAAKKNGWRSESVKADLRAACKAAFRDLEASGPSTISIPTVIGNIANKYMRLGFDSVESSWRGISAIRPVSDFKEITSFSLTGDLTYEEVAPGGEIKHGTLGETTYTNKATTYGKLLGLDRRDLINDDAGALDSAGKRLGRGGALKFNAVFWACWLDDTAFFPTNASLSNYDSGSDSLLTAVGLDNMTSIFEMQTDPDGNPMGLSPAILLVPVPLHGSALTLMQSEMLNLVSTTSAVNGQANIWRGRYTVVKSQYLAGSSAILKCWYLLANPNDLPAIESCFLNGVEMPTVESADMDFDRLGITLRGFHDFGVRKQEYRAAVKSKGDS